MSKHASLGRTPEVKRSLIQVGGAIAVSAHFGGDGHRIPGVGKENSD